jgi:hypothetical protein
MVPAKSFGDNLRESKAFTGRLPPPGKVDFVNHSTKPVKVVNSAEHEARIMFPSFVFLTQVYSRRIESHPAPPQKTLRDLWESRLGAADRRAVY